MSMLGFLRRGETIECLKEEGKEPEERDRLMILVMTGVRTGRHCLRRKVGMGSSSHCLEGDLRMRFVTSSRVVGRSRDSEGGTCGGWGRWAGQGTGEIAERSLETLSEKKVAKC